MVSETQYWVAFSLIRGIGAVRFRRLLSEFGSLQEAWQASSSALAQTGLSPKLVENILDIRQQVDVDQLWERIQKLEIQVLTWQDASYPRRLKEIDQPPPVLYLKGNLLEQDELAVAVVGTRKVTHYGRQVAQEIAAGLAQSGVTVISGLARGVDAIAHAAAMDQGGRTIAILGCGVDRIYPPENRPLAQRILQQGALLSDYPPGTAPDATNFPPRNRIISGLSLAVVVVEAGEKSGALITASFAADQGRDVFAVPGNIHAPQSVGTNRLIQEGAYPFVSVQDLLETLDIVMITQQTDARKTLTTDPTEAKLLEALTTQPIHVDELARLVELPVAQVSSTLTILELKGYVRSLGGMNYVAVHEDSGEYHIENA